MRACRRRPLRPKAARSPKDRRGRRLRFSGRWCSDDDAAVRVEVTLQASQVGADVGRSLVSELSVLLEGLFDDAIELVRNGRIQVARGERGLVANGIHQGRIRRAGERARARCHLIQHDTKREEIRPRVELLPEGLFWRHVRNRSAGFRQPRRVRDPVPNGISTARPKSRIFT